MRTQHAQPPAYGGSSRQHGVVTSTAGLAPFGHVGWGYRDRNEFLERAEEYIIDGLAQHQRVVYVGAGTREQSRADLASMTGIPDVSDVTIIPVPEFLGAPYGRAIVDPKVVLANRAAAVEHALDDGYSGFRTIVDATAVSRTAEQRDALACLEMLVDQQTATLPVAALCAYDMGQLPDDASGLICLHPLVNRKAPTFRMYANTGAAFALDGEIDSANEEVFLAALRRAWPPNDSKELVIDVTGLDFISHRPLLELDAYARSKTATVVLRNPQPILIRVCGLVELTNVRPG